MILPFRFRAIPLLGAGLLLVIPAPAASASSLPARSEIQAPPVDSLVAEALRRNPSLQASQYRRAAAEAEARKAGAYAPPEIAVETGRRAVPGDQGGMSMPFNGLSARQMIMFPGKVSAMERAERHRAAAFGWDARTDADRLALEVRDRYYELYMLQRQRDINAENRRVMEKFVGVARAQYEAGMGRLEDILRAQTELSRLRSEDAILARRHRGMEAMLNALLARPPETPLGRIGDPGDGRALPSMALLDSLARENRPELKAMAEDIGMSIWEAKAAQRSKFPDFMVEGKWMAMEGADLGSDWSVMAGVTVPLAPWSLGAYRGARDAARNRRMENEARALDMRNMVQAEVRQAAADVEAARERLELAEGATLPQAEQTVQSTEAAYRAGKTEFLMLLDAYRMLFMAREEAYMAKAGLERGWAGLERAVGLPRERISARAGGSEGGDR